eukprot:114767-Hanusia_phi.AAC.6
MEGSNASARGGDVDSTGHSSKTESVCLLCFKVLSKACGQLPVPMASNSDDAANRELVDQVDDLAVLAWEAARADSIMPLPAKGMDYEVRCKKYRFAIARLRSLVFNDVLVFLRTLVEKVPWPLEHGEDLSRYLLRNFPLLRCLEQLTLNDLCASGAIDPSNLPAPTLNVVVCILPLDAQLIFVQNVKSKEESMRLLREATSESSVFFMN